MTTSHLKYTEDHEWVSVNGNIATVGITNFAQTQLGDIVFVEIETEGETLAKGETFGTVEAVKTVSDLFMPISGKILEVNSLIETAPETINSDPYENGWLVTIEILDLSELDSLLDYDAYSKLI